jgi:hypothetical protein
VNIHGRIVKDIDYYTFSFTTAKKVKVRWILDGYFTAEGFEANSGLVATRCSDGVCRPDLAGQPSQVSLFFNGIPGIGNVYNTNVLLGSPELIATLDPGSYTFSVVGELNDTPRNDALYDISLTAVPLPAGAVLLLTGLAGLGIARRKRAA